MKDYIGTYYTKKLLISMGGELSKRQGVLFDW